MYSRPLSVLVLAGCLLPVGASAALARDEAAGVDVRVIELEADAALRFTRDGEQIFDIPVVPGEVVVFRIDNTAGFAHNYYIGTDAELIVPNATTEVGIPEWQRGTRELVWTVPDDITGLRFGSTVPGFYYTMSGCFSEARVAPGGTVERVGEAVPCPMPEITKAVERSAAPSPSPPPWFGGRVKVPEHGFGATLPDGWVGFDPALDADEQVDKVVRAFELDDWPEAVEFYQQSLGSIQQAQGELVALDSRSWDICVFGVRPDPRDSLDDLAAKAIERMLASGIDTDIDGPVAVDLPAGPARRITYSDTVTSREAALYLGEGVRAQFGIECRGFTRPADAWLSMAESFEFLPAEK